MTDATIATQIPPRSLSGPSPGNVDSSLDPTPGVAADCMKRFPMRQVVLWYFKGLRRLVSMPVWRAVGMSHDIWLGERRCTLVLQRGKGLEGGHVHNSYGIINRKSSPTRCMSPGCESRSRCISWPAQRPRRDTGRWMCKGGEHLTF